MIFQKNEAASDAKEHFSSNQTPRVLFSHETKPCTLSHTLLLHAARMTTPHENTNVPMCGNYYTTSPAAMLDTNKARPKPDLQVYKRSWIFQCGNDPSAGSPTETLLRLHLPLNDKV